MGIAPFAHGERRAGFGFATRGTADFRLDHVMAQAGAKNEKCVTRWDQEDARQSLRDQVLTHLASPDGVLVLYESAFVKTSGKFVGAQRSHGDASSHQHYQTGVFLAYSGPRGDGYLDRELFLPRPWVERSDLRISSGVPSDVAYCTRPEMARRMLERAFEHHVPHRYVSGAATFGVDRDLRAWLEERGEAYVLTVPSDYALIVDGAYRSAQDIVTSRSDDRWPPGAPGPDCGMWTGARLPSDGTSRNGARSVGRGGWERWLIARRASEGAGTSECYLAYVRAGTLLDDMVDAILASRRVHEGMYEARSTVGLDRFNGRSWEAWYRHMTVALMAHTVLGLARRPAHTGARRSGSACDDMS